MNKRVMDALIKWEYGKKYTLKEMFWDEVEQWDATDFKKWLYDAGTLLTHIFNKAIALPDDEIQQLGHLKKNLVELYTEDFPANFYTESNVFKYQKRSCSNCLFRPSCYLHIGKDWSVKWCDNGKAGCVKYKGPYLTEKRIKGRESDE